ncbi:hypothetical protein ACLBWP_17720 [Microbacterium sp. M1A1_1b]
MLLNDSEWANLIERLEAVTAKRSLSWEEVQVEDDSEGNSYYRAAVGETVYTLGAVDGDGVSPFFLEIWRDGKIFDQIQTPANRISADDLVSIRNGLRDLHREVGRAVNRAPERVAMLMSDLATLE